MITLPDDDSDWAILGIPPDADADARHQAYLARVREFPPDRAPAEFERIRDAYERLNDPLRRAEEELDAVGAREPLAEVLARFHRGFAYLGPKAWLDALRDGPK